MASVSWLDTYMGSLAARDEVERQNLSTFESYAELADTHSELRVRMQKTPDSVSNDVSPAVKAPPPPILGFAATSRWASEPASDPTRSSQLRIDLAAANKSYAALETQLKSVQAQLTAAKEGSTARDASIAKLKNDSAASDRDLARMRRKLHDRESELREKARLLSEVQDENVSLEIQVNVREERCRQLEQENAELVRRYMERVGIEAEELNAENSRSTK